MPRDYRTAEVDLRSLAPYVEISRCGVCGRLVRSDEHCYTDAQCESCPKFRLPQHIVRH